MYAVYIRISGIKHFDPLPVYVALRFRWLLEIWLHAIRSSLRCATWLYYLYTCSSNNRSNIDQPALLVLTKIHKPTKLFYIFQIDFRR